jgi:hypothetical protein
MRKKLIYNIIGLAILITGIVSCDQASQEASPIVEPDDSYPMVTYTQEISNTTLSEGDTVVLYTITTNKPIVNSLTFRATQTGGTATSEDYEIINAVIQPWSTEAQLTIIIPEGWQGEEDETLDLTVALTSLADKYLIHPNSTQSASISLTITNNDYPVEVMTHVDGADVAPDGEVSVYFDGPVTYVEGKTITFHDVYGYQPDEVINSSDDMTFEGGEYILNHSDFWEWTTIEMTVEAGAFVDAEGNENVETTFEFDIPFYLSSYTGTVQRTYFNWDATYVTDTVDVSIMDEDENIIGIPDIGFYTLADELDGDIQVKLDLVDYKADVLDRRYDLYLNYYDEPDPDDSGYLIESDTWAWWPTMAESSQFIVRGVTGVGYFDEIDFTVGVVYSIVTELVVGDGSYGTAGDWITTSTVTGEHVSKNSLESYNKVHRKLKIVDEVIKHGQVAYKVEFE